MQFPQVCRNIGIKFLSRTCVYTTLKCLGKHVLQACLSKSDETLFSEIYLCMLRLKQGIREIQNFIFWGREFQRDGPVKDMLVLNKPSLGPYSEHRFSGTFFQTLPDLVTPLKGNAYNLSPRSCPPTRSAPSERLGYWYYCRGNLQRKTSCTSV